MSRNPNVGWVSRILDRVDSDRRVLGERVEFVSKMSFSSISLVRSGSSISTVILAWSLVMLLLFDGVASGSLGLLRWLSKPPELLAMQTQEPKMKVVP